MKMGVIMYLPPQGLYMGKSASIPPRQESIRRKHTSSADDQGQGNGENQYMLFGTLPLLLAEPVHEEAEMHVVHRHADGDAGSNGPAPQPGEEPRRKEKGTQRLGDHQQDGGPHWKSHVGKGLQGSGKPESCKAAEDLLRPIGKHNSGQGNSDQELSGVVVHFEKELEHFVASIVLTVSHGTFRSSH